MSTSSSFWNCDYASTKPLYCINAYSQIVPLANKQHKRLEYLGRGWDDHFHFKDVRTKEVLEWVGGEPKVCWGWLSRHRHWKLRGLLGRRQMELVERFWQKKEEDDLENLERQARWRVVVDD